jgi:nitrate reductase NapAB chaperone NapD
MTVTQPLAGVAGLVVRARPDDLDDVLTACATRPGIDVHHREPAQGRAVLTLEVMSVASAEDELRALRALPGVLTVDLVFHHRIEEGAL